MATPFGGDGHLFYAMIRNLLAHQDRHRAVTAVVVYHEIRFAISVEVPGRDRGRVRAVARALISLSWPEPSPAVTR